MLCGLLNPSAGEIDVIGYRIPEDAEALKRRIGYMTQRFSLYEDLAVEENLAFLAAVNTVPGLVGMILTTTMVLFTAIALVRERERGNLEMLIASPVSPWELTVGKTLPFVGIGIV